MPLARPCVPPAAHWHFCRPCRPTPRAQAALNGSAAADREALLRLAKAATSPLVNELLTPGARAAERLMQGAEILADTGSAVDCGAWKWTPGGTRLKPRWVGPKFVLSEAVGSCALLTPSVLGRGSTSWTNVQLERIACQGPSLQYGFVRRTARRLSPA
jgi:hypothetical protein